ncbi:MAG: hypothetical protein GXY07_01515 [Candidatus Hydrogenedentes bacterium]|nr:hypothetical protein [Candidatus Hydrogenedentota bacterium]
MIQYNCPNCGANLNISDDYAGKPAICGGCGNTFQCPQQGIPVLPPVIPAAPVRRRTGAKVAVAVVLIAIVLVLLIGILDLSRSKTISNVSEAATSLKILAKWQIAYQAANADNGNYGSMAALCEFINYPGADPTVEDTIKQTTSPPGYTFDLRILPRLKNQEPDFFCIANPVNTGNPFKKSNPIRLYVDKSQIVRYTNDGSEPNAASRPFTLEELMGLEGEKESS